MTMKDEPDIFAELDLKRDRLLEQLAASPVVTVIGIVDATGSGGGRGRGDDLWTLSFAFAAWHLEDSEVRTDRLSIQRQVSDDELKQHMDRIKPYKILRARIHLAEATESGKAHGLLIDNADILESDESLNEWVIRLQEPVTLEDELFGKLTLNKRVNWYEAEAMWNGLHVKIQLSVNEQDDAGESLKTAHALWQSQDEWDQRIHDFAVQKLLPLKNDTWLDDDELEVTADQFKDRMTLEAVTVYSDGSFAFWHNDGDLFFGHAIMIKGTLSDGPTDADIPG